MTNKEYLQQAYRLDNLIDAKLEQITQLRAMAEKQTATLSAAPISGLQPHSRVENCMVKIVDLENEINRDIDRLVSLKRDIQQTISHIHNPDYRLLLELRYLNFKTWEQIAVQMHYSYRNILYLHGKALEQINKDQLS